MGDVALDQTLLLNTGQLNGGYRDFFSARFSGEGLPGLQEARLDIGEVVGGSLAELSLLGTWKVENPSKSRVLGSKVCTTSDRAAGQADGS